MLKLRGFCCSGDVVVEVWLLVGYIGLLVPGFSMLPRAVFTVILDSLARLYLVSHSFFLYVNSAGNNIHDITTDENRFINGL